MFWKFGGYANISPVDTILDRPDFTLEDLLDENELLADIKTHNSKLLEYLRQREVLEKLLDYVVAPKPDPVPESEKEEEKTEEEPVAAAATTDSDTLNNTDDNEERVVEEERGRPRLFGRSRASSFATDSMAGEDDEDEDDEAEKKRNKYAFVSCEILSSDNWSICEVLMDMDNRDLLHKFWQFLKRDLPLDPLQASYFTKVNESLFDRKVDEMVEFLKSADQAVPDMLRHVDCPMIMDLLLKIITLDRPDSCPGIVEWLHTQGVMPTLLAFLNPKHSWATQTSAGDFIKAIITVSANAGQNEQTCIGPNELTRELVSHPCIDELITYMLGGGNALTVGVGIVIEVIRKNNSDYDPDVGTEANSIPSSRDPIYLGTLLRMFAENVPNFMLLMKHAPAQKTRLNSTFGERLEPLGFDRFKTCELMAELLHCSNMGLLNEVGSEELISARDTERKRLRKEGKLTPNRGEEAVPSSADLLTMRIPQNYAADEGRRLEVTNISPADDGFEEVTHTADLGDENRQQRPSTPPSNGTGAATSNSFFDKDEDDFVEEPLSSPRLNTLGDEKLDSGNPDAQFDEPDLVVAPLSPSKNKTPRPLSGSGPGKSPLSSVAAANTGSSRDDLPTEPDYVTEATEPALGEEAKKLMSDPEKGDDSESSIIFTPTISSLSDTLDNPPRTPSPTPAALATPDRQKAAAVESAVAPESQSVEPLTTFDVPKPLVLLPKSRTGEESEEEEKKPIEETTPGREITANDDAETEDASIVIGHLPDDDTTIDTTSELRGVDPVVGDYLKMQFVEHRVVPTILSFFFEYPWNNFLHNVVYDVVQQVFNGPMDRGFNPHLAISLFESADVTTQIIQGQLASEKSQTATRTRMGYMGHLTLIAEEVVKFTERHPPEMLSETVLEKVMSQDWINYVEGPLAETRERDNAVLGGVRPEVAVNNQAAAAGLAAVGLSGLGSSFGFSSQGSSALADAGLNGGLDLSSSDSGTSSFSISAGISSGFHSSSDEEDDDTDDNEEDVNNEFRAYTDPENASSSLLPPSIPPPPPPPPLNIPPSRARLQLAARLAMNKRNAEAAAAQEEKEGEDGDISGERGVDNGYNDFAPSGSKSLSGLLHSVPPPPERLRNPFADDEDNDDDDDVDDEDDDDDGDLNGAEGGDGTGRVGLGWNRGSWWRSMVRGNKNAATAGGAASGADGGVDIEKFGDGRDSSDEDDDRDNSARGGGGVGDEEDEDDEEFGDFAMPEVTKEHAIGSVTNTVGSIGISADPAFSSTAASADGNGSGNGPQQFDQDREKFLFKPLAVHPPSATSTSGSTVGTATGTTTGVSGLWPFERLGFLTNAGPNGKDNRAEDDQGSEKTATGTTSAGVSSSSTALKESTAIIPSATKGDEKDVSVGESGHKTTRALEDPEDEVVV